MTTPAKKNAKKSSPKRTSSKQRKGARTSHDEERALSSAESPWRQVVVDVNDMLTEAITSTLLEAGALGIEVHDDTTRSMPGRLAHLTGKATIVAPFSRARGLEARVTGALTHVVSFFDDAGEMEIAWSDLFVEDWNAAFKKEWRPLTISERVWIVPSWDRADFVVPDAAVALYLDPGLAFGTGTHETTRLCARAIDEACARGVPTSLLDVGTGTGILALAALALGVPHAIGTDIDPVAVKAALDNARENALDDRFAAFEAAPDVHGKHPVVVANILAEPLIFLAPQIARAVAPGGHLYLSGLLKDQARAVREAYVKQGLRDAGSAEENGWMRLDFMANG
jgi:ribosomal protein L11 methyltransferase